MKLHRLAWKNLARYRRRTVITSVALAVGLMFFVVMDSMLKGAEIESKINLTRYETGSGVIGKPAFFLDENQGGNRSIDELLDAEQTEAVATLLEENNIKYAPRIQFTGEIILEYGSFPVAVTAVDAYRDEEIFSLADKIGRGGRYLNADPAADRAFDEGVVIGQWLAEDFGLEVGDFIDLNFVSANDAAFFEVVGILESPNPVINRSGVFIDLPVAQYYLNRGGVSGFSLLSPDDPTLAGTVGKAFAKRMEMLAEVYDPSGAVRFMQWQELAADYILVSQSKQGGSKIFLFLIFLVAAIGISNTLLMSMLERTREIGMMRAMGMEERQIRRLFLFEASFIGAIGSFGGVILGAAANFYLVRNGIDYGPMLRDMDIGYRILSVLYGTWDAATFVTAFFAGVFIAFIVGVISLRKSLKMDITDSLRYQ